MSDWRSERKEERKAELEKRILGLRKEAEEQEMLIATVEREGVMVTPADDATVCCYGIPIDMKGLFVSTADDTFVVEAGCNDDDKAIVTFATLRGAQPKITMDKNEKGELVNIAFSGKDAIKEALGVLRAATVLLRAQSRRKNEI